MIQWWWILVTISIIAPFSFIVGVFVSTAKEEDVCIECSLNLGKGKDCIENDSDNWENLR